MSNGSPAKSVWAIPGVEDQLRAFVSRGLSSGQISNALRAGGHAVTRNAVVGKCNRLGLTLRGGVPVSVPAKLPPRKRAAPNRALSAQMPEFAPDRAAGSGPVSLMSAVFGDCRWPVSGEGAGLMVCGKLAHPGKPYCCEHAGIAYVGVSNPRKGEAWWLGRFSAPTVEVAE